jgi:hypothetical protein
MSGWRAGLIALALGGVILAIGWLATRDGSPSTTTDPGAVDADVTLACTEAFHLVCDELADRLVLRRADFSPGQEIPADTLVIAFAGDIAELAPTAFARSPIAIAAIGERAPALERSCGTIDISCLVGQAGASWGDLGAPSAWGTVKLGLAHPNGGVADLEAWRLVAGASPANGFGETVALRSAEGGDLMLEWIQFPTRADVVVAAEVVIAGQLVNFQNRTGRLEVFYPDPTPYLQVGAFGEGRAARNVVEQLNSADIQALLGSLGLRPMTGEAQGLLEGLGSPGGEMAPLSPTDGPALVAKWDELVGG